MWVITGPFDGDVSNEVGFQKSKLLKSGKSYLIGRKSTCDLVVNHKKVSHDHGRFEVGGFSPDDVTNVNYMPTLRILNSKNKTMRIWREGVANGIIVNPSATESLQHNDKVDIVSGLPLLIQWQRICCFETPGKVRSPIPIDGCASLGIYVVRTLHPDVTHHIVPSYALTPAHMTSLLSAAQLVKPEWLSELLALSILDPRESTRALEHTFVLPPESKFRPGFAAALPPTFKTFKTWEPNEARLNMLKGYRFVFVGEKGLEIPAGYRDLVKRGGAEYEAFTLSAGVVRLRKALLRAKTLADEKLGKVSPVADVEAMEAAVGAEEWKEIVSVAKSLDLEFIQPENILQAVASVDTFFVDSANSQGPASRETPLPDVVPNTLSSEPSIPPPLHPPKATSPEPTTSKRPLPTVASLSEPPAPEPEIAEVPIPRRLPPRRANRTAPSPGPGDDGAIVGASPSPAPPPALNMGDVAPAATQLPTPVSQTRKLPPRRRANQGTDASSALISSSSSNPQASHSHFSQLDKYKALFDASNPDRAPPSGEIESGTGPSGTLSSVPEEEQQESVVQTGNLRGTKRGRGAESGDDVDVEMVDITADVAGTGTGTGTVEVVHRAKRRALDANSAPPPTGASAPVPAPQSGSTQTQGQGKGPAATGTKPTTKGLLSKPSSSNNKLDTDENFLKAVNSTKRGKKHEDNFDREFNQLRITKPRNVNTAGPSTALAAATKGIPEAVVAPWDAIDDFGDVGIRGNFMIVVEMDIQRGGSAKPAPPARTNDAAHPEWMGRPNFKKFKTKRTALERRETIELVPSEENDYGIGSAYWRAAASGSQSHSDIHDITAAHPPEALLYGKSKSKSKPKPKPLSKASRASANSRGGRARAPHAGENDDEDEDEGVVESLDLEADEMEIDVPVPPLKPISTRSKTGPKATAAAAKPPSKAKASTNTKAPAAAKGKGKAPARTKKAPAARSTTKRRNPALFLSDDDEDEEDEIIEEDEIEDEVVHEDASEAVVALELGADVSGTGTGTGTGTFGHASAAAAGDDERVVDAPGMSSTLRSTAPTQLRKEAVRAAAKRRAAALVGADGDDSDDDAAVFKGFGARKRGRR